MRYNISIIVFCATTCWSIICTGQTAVATWHLDETAGLQSLESVGQTVYSVKNIYPKMEAEWMPGASANSLRFNGYATWIEGNLATAMPQSQATITAWVAPEVWPFSTAAIFTNQSLSGGGAYLGIDKFGRLETSVTVNGQIIKRTSTEKIPIGQWSLVALTADANAGKLRGYLNGNLILEQNTPVGTLHWASPNAVKIGKLHTQTNAGIYETGLFCGLIDEVNVYSEALTPSALTAIYQIEAPLTEPDLSIPASRFDGDLHRPIFHAIPPANWMNEPHGLVYYEGQYHIFYQKNGNGPYWGRLNWGHQTSPDLVSWTEQKVVLSPDPDLYDKEGCWSGVSFTADEKTFIMYTGVDGATAQMCLAESSNGFDYQKFTGNPVVLNPPAPYTANDFRDPYIWQENGNFYMIIGTGNATGGAALMYKSADYINWQYLYPIKKGVAANDFSGTFWELPMFLDFGQKRVFVAQPVPGNGAPARILYWTGTFQNEVFTADSIKPTQLEPGDALLGVTTTTDTQGRTIAIGIIPDILPDFEQRKNGWANLMSLPRIWSLSADGTRLLQKPLPELSKLRGENHSFQHLVVAENQANHLAGVLGRHLEIRTTIEPGTATKAGIILAKSADNSEYTRIYWDLTAGILVIDRTRSSVNSAAPSVFLTTPIQQNGQALNLHIFLDGSVLEVFINDEKALSTRIFPENPGSTGLDLYTQGGNATFSNLDVWEMKSMHDPSVTGVETPDFFIKSAIENVFPNPSDGSFFININLPGAGNVSAQLFDVFGKTIATQPFGQQEPGNSTLVFSPKNLPTGTYFLQMLHNGQPIGTTTIFKQ
jgi:sucrose-6-phosphate hydrolase SacC (GH32 family)